MYYVAFPGDEIARHGLCQVVFHVVELCVLFLVDYFLVGEGGESLGIPVDHTHAAVDEPFAIEIHEDLDDALAAGTVHGEGGAIPVAGAAELAELLEDDASVLLGPGPGVLQEFFTGEVSFLDTLFSQAVDNLGFGGDGGMVCAGHPAGVLAFHAGVAHEDVLNGLIQYVAHVEDTCHVGWRDDHGVGLAAIGLGAEELVV